jgi:hypothetical protein
MTKKLEKYVAKALEGYEQNYKGITDAIYKLEEQLKNYQEHQAEMLEGITEMKDILGLSDEEETTDLPPRDRDTVTVPVTLVKKNTTSE